MDHSELVSLIFELKELNERFKIGLTIFIEGAQGFHGNLRLLLDPYIFQECNQQLFELIQQHGLCWDFCLRGEASFIVIR